MGMTSPTLSVSYFYRNTLRILYLFTLARVLCRPNVGRCNATACHVPVLPVWHSHRPGLVTDSLNCKHSLARAPTPTKVERKVNHNRHSAGPGGVN